MALIISYVYVTVFQCNVKSYSEDENGPEFKF